VSSGYIPAKDEPRADEIIEALREAVFEKPRLREMPAEEVARQLVLEGRLQQEPSPVLVAEMLDALETEEEGFEANELSEESNPT
jgi:polyhydroxyalkanoate synthesis regulator phasin